MPKTDRKLTGSDIVAGWEKAQAKGALLSEYAASIGMTENAVRSKIYRVRKKAGTNPVKPVAPTGNKVKANVQGNYMTLETGFTRRILTLEDLLEAGKVDLSEWEVERYIVNKWEVGAKTAERHLEWNGGRIATGFIDDPGKLTIEPLIQVKAWLVRKKPIALEPTLQPVTLAIRAFEASTPFVKTYSRNPTDWKRALILPDMQFGFRRDLHTGRLDPYHSRRALDVALQVAQSGHFDHIVALGDTLDLPEWSDKFIRSPDFYFTTQAAVVEAAWWFAQFRQAQPDADMTVLEGNHDLRMLNAISVHLASAYNLRPATEIAMPPALSVPRLLALDAIGAEWVGGYPNGILWLNDQLACVHGEVARGTPGATAAAMVEGSTHSVIFGHIHRVERASRTLNGRADPWTIVAASPGCLCRLDFVVPGHTKKSGAAGWQNGFAVAHYHPDGRHFVDLYQIENGQVMFEGAIYAAGDRLEEIRHDTKWSF